MVVLWTRHSNMLNHIALRVRLITLTLVLMVLAMLMNQRVSSKSKDSKMLLLMILSNLWQLSLNSQYQSPLKLTLWSSNHTTQESLAQRLVVPTLTMVS